MRPGIYGVGAQLGRVGASLLVGLGFVEELLVKEVEDDLGKVGFVDDDGGHDFEDDDGFKV